jgi:superkiller protein 3
MVAALVVFFLDWQSSRQALEQAQVHLERGIQLYQQKAYAHAQAELRRALRANPDDWKAPFYVGAVQIEEKRYGMAIPYLERALTLNPTESKILNALGVTYFKLGRLDMAKGYFWASLEVDPTNKDAKGLMETMAKAQWRTAQAAAEK